MVRGLQDPRGEPIAPCEPFFPCPHRRFCLANPVLYDRLERGAGALRTAAARLGTLSGVAQCPSVCLCW